MPSYFWTEPTAQISAKFFGNKSMTNKHPHTFEGAVDTDFLTTLMIVKPTPNKPKFYRFKFREQQFAPCVNYTASDKFLFKKIKSTSMNINN